MPQTLIISPVRSWPCDQGNRTRIQALGQLLRARGHRVHFVLSELEGRAGEDVLARMAGQWDLVRSVPYTHQRRQRFADAWGADDWYDPALDAVVAGMCRAWDYDLCLVNYAWMSRALDQVPQGVFRAIDTHDAFGDRHKRLYAAGTSPAWYYTRPEEEALCLDRADCVIAIQEEEQAWFESLSNVPVRTIGHVTGAAFLPPRAGGQGRYRIGYLASGNPSNRQSITTLIRHWRANGFLADNVELHVAGAVCEALAGSEDGFLVSHGVVPDPAGFYAGMDAIVNPNIGGSGLKIKSVEALAFGRPLFATREGMLGICPTKPPYVVETVDALVTHLAAVLQTDPGLDRARRWARDTYLSYRDRQIAAFDALLADVAALRATGEATR